MGCDGWDETFFIHKGEKSEKSPSREIYSVSHYQTAFVDIPSLIRKQLALSWVCMYYQRHKKMNITDSSDLIKRV